MAGLIISCEHASRRVPDEYAAAFDSVSAKKALETHRAYDPGALPLARGIKKDVELLTREATPLAAGSMTRLLIDLNRSPQHRSVLSEFSREMSRDLQSRLKAYHRDYHDALRSLVLRTKGQIIHLAVHTFVPVWDGEERTTDVGILFDPARPPEMAFAKTCQDYLQQATGLRVHRNAPYRGVADGLPTLLRREFSQRKYIGIELEVNQRLVFAGGRQRALKNVRAAMVQVLVSALDH